ncbi:MAG: tetratricopeptide repeat protein [Pyrinomonadaceae bacterium]|nr:tetratricopeptide repeat protein [Pyrinomonadaceae bacterium]
MKRIIFNTLSRLLIIVSLCVSASAEETWTQVRSKNFSLVGNASEREIRKVAAQLEGFRDAFGRLYNRSRQDTAARVTVFVFKDDISFKPFKPLYNGRPAELAAYFQSGTDMNYIALTPEKRIAHPYAVVYHEYVHLLLSNNTSNAPLWFNEGLAEYYSMFDVDGKQRVKIGAPVFEHARLLRESNVLPLRTLLTVDGSSPFYKEADKRGIFYAQSWALVHYLIHGREGARFRKLQTYFDLVASGKPLEESFRTAFDTDFAGMENELGEYVRRAHYPTKIATFEHELEFDAQMQSARLTEAEALSYLGDLLLHINRLDAAETYLREALALDPKSAAAHVSLGVLRVRAHRFDDAKEHLEKALALDAGNFLAHYYYAYALSREGMDGNQFISEYRPETVERMRAELEQAIKLAPDFPNSYYLLAFINLVTRENLDESIQLLRRAIAIAPDRAEFSFVLAQVFVRKSDFAQARHILEPLMQSNPDPHLRAQARRVMDSISIIEEWQAQTRLIENQRSTERASLATNMPMRVRPAEGEQQQRGALAHIECPAGNSAVLVVETTNGTRKFYVSNLTRLKFITYTTEISREITCGALKTLLDAIITYRPAKEARRGFEGEAVAVEFLPKDWSEGN